MTKIQLFNLLLHAVGFAFLSTSLLGQFKVVKHKDTLRERTKVALIGALMVLACFEIKELRDASTQIHVSLLIMTLIGLSIIKLDNYVNRARLPRSR